MLDSRHITEGRHSRDGAKAGFMRYEKQLVEEIISLRVVVSPNPNGRYDAICNSVPQFDFQDDTIDSVLEKMGDALSAWLEDVPVHISDLGDDDRLFMSDARRILDQHSGAPDEWLPISLDEGQVSIGKPVSHPRTLDVFISGGKARRGSYKPRPVHQELVAVAV